MVDSRAGARKIQDKPGALSNLESKEAFKNGGKGENVWQGHRSQPVRGLMGQNRKHLSEK